MNVKQFVVQSGMIIVFGFVVLAAFLIAPQFLSLNNMISLGLQVTSVGIVACAMLFCLAGGDFDLSVGSTLALGGMVAVLVANASGSLWLGTVAAVGAGAAVGSVNGVVISRFGINALITTLATMQIVRGLTNILGHGTPVTASRPGFEYLGNQTFFSIPLPIWIMIGFFVLFGILLNKTVFGRNTLAIGGNREAAHLAGIPVARTKMAVFIISGMAAAFAGVITASRLVVASNNAGEKLELQAISACVLGGVSLSGGVGTMSGTVVGVLIMGIVENVMRLKNVDAFYQMVVTGIILLLAVLLDRAKYRLLAKQ
ncbi:MAG: L-arabinose ABC transporter permease AraH [Fimbriimonadia bacterium]|jgi:L-arabinose transport system permease protein